MMPVSTSSGDAPGQEMLTDTVGLSTSGNWLTPMRVTAMIPKRIVPHMIIQAKTWFLRQTSVRFTERSRAGDGEDAAGRKGACGGEPAGGD